jgi:23S rRNA (uracil1939-C5)-methyltransferase
LILKKNDIIECRVESVAFGGKGVAKSESFVIFVKNALPGQLLKVRIQKVKKNYAEAAIVEILEQSPNFIDPPCPYFYDCGGCTLQHTPYENQLLIKKQQIAEVFRQLGQFEELDIKWPLPSPEIWGYRNKMEFSASDERWILKKNDSGSDPHFAIGLHAPGRFDKVVDIHHCLLQDAERNELFQLIRNFIRANAITLHNPRRHYGFLRNVIIRKGVRSGELMVNFVTFEKKPEIFQELIKEMHSHFPNLVSVINTISSSWGMSVHGEEELILYGRKMIYDKIGKLDYEIAPTAFFQTNTLGAELLYETIRSFAGLSGSETVWDFYTGTGSIALFLAPFAKELIGFELVKEAVDNANFNAANNHINNCRFFQANLDSFLQKEQLLINSLPPPDLAVVDPPRSGLNPKFLKQLIQLKAPRLIYVSCNPATMARDMRVLVDNGYKAGHIQPVDMFPHTWHIENVTELSL